MPSIGEIVPHGGGSLERRVWSGPGDRNIVSRLALLAQEALQEANCAML